VIHLGACALLLVVLAVPFPAEGQPPKGIPRIGFLSSTTAEEARGYLAAFRQGLRELGCVEGQNILVEQRYAGIEFERLPALAAELVDLKVDVSVTGGAPAAHAAKQVTRAIPIVMAYAADPVGTGLVANLARPGGNVTGLSDFNAGIVVKRLELLKEVVPAVSRVAALLSCGAGRRWSSTWSGRTACSLSAPSTRWRPAWSSSSRTPPDPGGAAIEGGPDLGSVAGAQLGRGSTSRVPRRGPVSRPPRGARRAAG
jgi:hypothetical protein